MRNARFRVARQPTAIVANTRRRPPRGSAFLYSLTAPGTVRIVIKRREAGRLVGGRCVKPSRASRRRRRCSRLVAVGALTRRASPGRNETRFSGRLGRRALAPGSYLAHISATNGRSTSFTYRPRVRPAHRVAKTPRPAGALGPLALVDTTPTPPGPLKAMLSRESLAPPEGPRQQTIARRRRSLLPERTLAAVRAKFRPRQGRIINAIAQVLSDEGDWPCAPARRARAGRDAAGRAGAVGVPSRRRSPAISTARPPDSSE